MTVTGKAFFDIGNAPKDQSNRRTDLAGLRCVGNSSGDAGKDVKSLTCLLGASRAKVICASV